VKKYYDDKYRGEEYYWGMRTSSTTLSILKYMPPVESYRLLDIGCGEGQNAVFFARNGYDVTAFDLAAQGLVKAKRLAEKAGVSLKLFQADINEFRLAEEYDILFSSGVLHYIPEELREEIFNNYKRHTRINGIHMFSVFVQKPFIPRAPDVEETARLWKTGELFSHYHDWKVELCTEEIFDCQSSGVPHKHAVNRILSRKIEHYEI
jgi:tellurite methyltransferase